MKRLMVFVFVLGLVFLSSCSAPKKPDYVWTGETLELLSIFQPVFAVHCKPSEAGWILHTSTSDVDLIKQIILEICDPEEEELIEISEDQPHEILWFAYLDPRVDKWEFFKVRFRIENGKFVGPRGKSKKLIYSFFKMNEVKPYFKMPTTFLPKAEVVQPDTGQQGQQDVSELQEALKWLGDSLEP